MAYENLCMYCFEDLNGETVCPHCGQDANAAVPQIQAMPGTTVYHGRFLIGRALGQDSSGIVYNALDTKKGNTIRIREYLPRNCAERLMDGNVVPVAGMEDAFDTGMRKLKASVENTDDPKKKHFYFEENGTAYIAQRRSAAMSGDNSMEDIDDDEPREKSHLALFIGIASVITAVVVVGVLLLLNKQRNDQTAQVLPSPTTTTDPQTTWLPAETPTPTPYVTATFAALVDPELSWMDFTTASATSVPQATATTKPSVDTSGDYQTIRTGSSEESIRGLQQKLAQLGWMSRNQITGKYDATTTQAVKDFQDYVNNNCSPATKLKVDGIAGKKTQQWLYNSSVSLVKPTATPRATAAPTPVVTAAPDTSVVGPSSSASAIKSVQRKLVKLGLLKGNAADGKYGSDTKAAVRKFQTRVNEILGYDVLEVSGTVDELTMAYLDYYVDWWESMQSATATPSARPTATPAPTAASTVTAAPTAASTTIAPEEDETIDSTSPKEQIKALQQDLVKVGLLSEKDVDGSYGNKTKTAVKNFQNWVNTNRGTKTLSVTGIADSMTQQYLQYCIDRGIQAVDLNTPVATEAPSEQPTDAPTDIPTEQPTAEPTQEPTAEPTEEPTAEPTVEPTQEVYEPEEGEGESGFDGIGEGSETESITYMQEMLAGIKLIGNDKVTGSYDSATKEAVRLFQQFVNSVQGDGTLEENGLCDTETQKYLQYAFDHGWDVGAQMGLDTDQTDTEQTDPVDGTTAAGSGIDTGSDAQSISEMQSLLVNLGLMNGVTGVYDGLTEDAVLTAQSFINSVIGPGTVPENGQCTAETLEYLKMAVNEGWNMVDTGDQPGYTEETEPEIVEEPTKVPVAEIVDFEITIDGTAVGDSIEIESGRYSVAWSAGGVQSYSIYLYTQDGTLVNKQENTGMNGFMLDTAGMVEGSSYEVRIGALPQGGTTENMVWRSLYVTLKPSATEAPAVVETPIPVEEQEIEVPMETEEPFETVTEEPVRTSYVGVPVINIGSAVYQQGGITYINDSIVIFTWAADGDVESYDVVLIYEEDGTRYTLGTTTDTSKTVNSAQLQPGMYTLVVSVNPIGGGESTSSQMVFCVPEKDVEEEVTAEPEPQVEQTGDTSTVNTEIRNIQMALYRYGLIDPDSIQVGVLDYQTLAAVAEFQSRVNEVYGRNLPVLDPGSATSIDLETLNVLLNETLDLG